MTAFESSTKLVPKLLRKEKIYTKFNLSGCQESFALYASIISRSKKETAVPIVLRYTLDISLFIISGKFHTWYDWFQRFRPTINRWYIFWNLPSKYIDMTRIHILLDSLISVYNICKRRQKNISIRKIVAMSTGTTTNSFTPTTWNKISFHNYKYR